MTGVIWTIGYGTETFDHVERRLADEGISMVLDVRPEPDDPRAPDFQRRRFEELCAQAGIGYRWLGSSFDGTTPSRFREAIGDVIAVASAARTVLLCREPDPATCRRATVIAPALRSREVAVRHILHDGSIRPHEAPLPLDP